MKQMCLRVCTCIGLNWVTLSANFCLCVRTYIKRALICVRFFSLQMSIVTRLKLAFIRPVEFKK